MKDEGASYVSPSTIPTIETARLLLRPFAQEDLEDYPRLIFADADVMRYLPKRDLAPRERAERTVAVFNDQWLQRDYSVWAVTDKMTGGFIGHCGLNSVIEAGEVEVLYALRKDRWGQGIATEAARASVRFGFETVNLARLIALAVAENSASRRVMERLGFAYEKDVHYFGLDLVYSVLAREQFNLDDSVFPIR